MGVVRLYNKKGCCYIRVSTDRQEELSPDAQKRLILDYAEENNIEIDPEDIYMDLGISGKKADKRPEFKRMIAVAKQKEHPYDVILVWKFSRFARNQEESIVYKALLKKNNVDVISISEPLVDGPFGSLIERIIEWMDEYYSIRLSGEVKRGMQEKILRKGYITTAPYGYDHKRGEVPTINDAEAEAVRIIFDKYVNEHASIRGIAELLNEHGYTTKRGSRFDNRRVLYILQNAFYIGKMRLGETLYDGVHEPIISDDLFQSASARYQSEYRPINRKPPSACAHWLSGVLVCPVCGGSLGYNRGVDKTGKAYPIFYCWKSGKGICSAKTSIAAHKAEQYVIDGLHELLQSNQFEYDIIRSENTDEEYESLKKRLESIRKKEERAKNAYLDGIDSLADYKENKTILATEKEKILERIAQIDASLHEYNDDSMFGSVKNVIEILEDDSIEKERKATALRSVCKRIEYDKSTDELTFHLYYSA